MSKADEPAFAHVIGADAVQYVATGLTKREYFAAMAMQALITAVPSMFRDVAANEGVLYADALIAALERKPE
jgi:hypothetical protein